MSSNTTSSSSSASGPRVTLGVGPTVDVHLVYGPLLLGVFFNMILKSPRRDRLWMRILVWGVFSLETANTIAIPRCDDFDALRSSDFALWWSPRQAPKILNPCRTAVCYPRRLPHPTLLHLAHPNPHAQQHTLRTNLRRRRWCKRHALGGGLWTAIGVLVEKTFANIPHLYDAARTWLITSAVTDLAIATSLSLALRRKKTGFAATDTVVDRIIRSAWSTHREFFAVTVQTGLITALFSVLDVTCLLTLRGDTINFLWNIPLSKLYSNCLLSTLNARDQMRHGLGSEHAGTGVNGSGPQVLSGGRKVGAAAPPANVVLPGSPDVDSGYGFGYEGDSKMMQDSIGMMEFSPNESEERGGHPANGEYGVQSVV